MLFCLHFYPPLVAICMSIDLRRYIWFYFDELVKVRGKLLHIQPQISPYDELFSQP